MNTYKEPYLPYQPDASDRMNTTIDAGNQTLLRQAPMTANTYLMSAIDHIDQQLGKGYAKAHPELIGAFMQTSAMDIGAAVIARAVETLANKIKTDEIVEQIANINAQLEEGEISIFSRQWEEKEVNT